jgi:hypothetical protein
MMTDVWDVLILLGVVVFALLVAAILFA